MANEFMKYVPFVGIVVALVVGLGAGILLSAPAPASSVFHMTLVITDSNTYNNESQPAYFILADNGSLIPAGNLHVPLNTKIQLTIINYDEGDDANITPSQYLNVVGTDNGKVLVVADENVNSTTLDNKSIDVHYNENATVSAVTALSHTFTVIDNNGKMILNIPVAPDATTTAIVTFHTASSSTGFTWQCYVPCGSGSDGWGGAMATQGWMAGKLIVS